MNIELEWQLNDEVAKLKCERIRNCLTIGRNVGLVEVKHEESQLGFIKIQTINFLTFLGAVLGTSEVVQSNLTIKQLS